MVHTQSNIGNISKRVLSFILVFLIIGIMTAQYCSVGAVNKGSYSGKYDLDAPHVVNMQYNPYTNTYDEAKCDANLAACYQQFLAWGLTKNAAIAIVGNFRAEGCGGTDTTEGWSDWEDFTFGSTGIGLMGFTWWELQEKLFNNAYDMGVQWMDVGAQLKTIKDYYFPLKDMYYEEGYSIDELAADFCIAYERPAVNNTSDRASYAHQYFDKFKDLPAKDYDGSLADYSANGKTTESDTLTGDGSTEWDLVGMPAKSNLSAEAALGDVKFVTVDNIEDVTQRYSVAVIKEDIESLKSFNAWTTARTIVVFFGLLLLIYSLLLLLAMLFDKLNNIIDISLVGVLTFGLIKFSDDKEIGEESEEKGNFINTRKMVIVIIVIAFVGGVLVAGGVVPFIMKSVYKITNGLS